MPANVTKKPERRDGNERRRPISYAEGPNPKDLVGSSKVSISKFPFIGIINGSHAMMDGGYKYGPYNWRAKKIQASIYVDAIFRHVGAWFEGEEHASDSLAHHLGHAIACCAILLDAQAHGRLIDDRPGDEMAQVVGTLLVQIQERIAKMPSRLKKLEGK